MRTAGLAWVLSVAACALAAEPQTTTITLTDTVLLEDAMRLGINLGGDAYYSGAALVKLRSWANFEGTSYRQCHFGPVQDEHGATTWFSGRWGSWDEILKGAKYTLLSGPAKGTTGTIKEISKKKAMHQRQMKDQQRDIEPGVVRHRQSGNRGKDDRCVTEHHGEDEADEQGMECGVVYRASPQRRLR